MDENENVVEETIVDNDETVGNIETEQQENQTEEQQEQAEEVKVTDGESDSTEEEQVQEPEKQHSRMYTEEEYQRAINKIIARERGNKEKEINPLLATLKAVGFDGKTPQEVNQKLRQNYKEQGVEIPEYHESMSEREQKALAKLDAEEVIELGEQAMQDRFGELYQTYKQNNILGCTQKKSIKEQQTKLLQEKEETKKRK